MALRSSSVLAFPSNLATSYLMGRTVVFQNQRMIHGNVRRSLVEVAHRIAACGHHISQQFVGVRYCASGAVNEP